MNDEVQRKFIHAIKILITKYEHKYEQKKHK